MKTKLQLDKIGSLGAVIAAALAPCCFPLLGVAAATFGFGAAVSFAPKLHYAVQFFVVLALAGSVFAYRRHRRIAPLLLAVAGVMLCLIHYYVRFSEPIIYAGFTMLVASGLWNTLHNRRMNAPKTPLLESTLTCPECGHRQTETMPAEACQFFWDCPQCGITLKPKPGDCCVFCSFGDVPCPPIQTNGACC